MTTVDDALSGKVELGFVPELLGLRGLLALIVVTAHIGETSWFWAWGTMEVFFALSGFLIGRQILSYVQQPGFWKKYLVRRSLRIWPLYYTWLLISIGVNLLWGLYKYGDSLHMMSWSQVVFPLFYLQNTPEYFGVSIKDVPYRFGHSWSLAIEEQFYMLAPFIIMATSAVRASIRRWLLVTSGLIFISIVFRVEHSYWLLLSRLDGFCVGLFLAVLWVRLQGRHVGNTRERVIFGTVLAYAIANISTYLWQGCVVGFSDDKLGRVFDFGDPVRLFLLNPYLGFALLAGCIIYRSAFYAESSAVLWVLRTRLFRYLGLISYSLYLSQVLIVRDIVLRLTGSYATGEVSLLDYFLSAIFIVPVAHFFYYFIELRFLKLKEMFAYSDRSSSGGISQRELP